MSIKQTFNQDDNARQEFLERARDCAALSNASILPHQNKQKNDPLYESYQSLGNRGVEGLVGKLITTMFPPGAPFFAHKLSSRIIGLPGADPEEVRDLQSQLYGRDRIISKQIESIGIHSPMRRVLRNLLVVGNFLLQIMDDYTIKVFRLDNWVVRRTGSGRIIYTIAREKIDPLSLTEDQIKRANLDLDTLLKQDPIERLEDLYTKSEWDYRDKVWVITQECNEQMILAEPSREPVSQFIVGGLEDTGDDYFRGFIEQNKGDLKSHNGLSKARNDISAAMARLLVVNDPSSTIRSRTLEQHKQGAIVSGRVTEDGRVRGVAFLQTEKVRDLGTLLQAGQIVKADLDRVMLMELDQQPKGDRVTATQVLRIAQELEGGRGGLFSAASDQIQEPLLKRIEWMMIRDGLVGSLPVDSVDVEIITGFAALTREIEIQQRLVTVQLINSLGEAAIRRLKVGRVTDDLIELRGQDPADFVFSDEEMAAQQQQEQSQQLQQQAGQQTVESLGKIAEQEAGRSAA